MSELVSIVYKPQNGRPAGEDYLRIPLDKNRLVAGYGIEGDGQRRPSHGVISTL